MQLAIDIALILIYILLFCYILVLGFKFWVMGVQQRFINKANKDTIMLEIRLPRIIDKSPEAFEIASHAFRQTGGIGNTYSRVFKGAMPSQFSLEIASIEGEVKFYIRTHKKFKQLICNNLYSQYPTLEIVESEDYTKLIKMDHHTDTNKVNIWGITFRTGEETLKFKELKDKKLVDKEVKIKSDYKLMKTYVDYKLDRDPKEEYKHDPLTPVLEWLGSLGKNEYGWYQINLIDESVFDNASGDIVTPRKKWPALYLDPETHEHYNFKALAKKRLDYIRKINFGPSKIKGLEGDVVYDEYGNAKTIKVGDATEDLKYKKDVIVDAESLNDGELRMEEKEEVERILRKVAKPLFAATMRVAYVNKNNTSNGMSNFGSNIQSTLSAVRYFTGPGPGAGYLSFIPGTSDPYEYAWQDSFKKRKPWRREEFFESYVEREGFFPHTGEPTTRGDVSFFSYSIGLRKIISMLWTGFSNPLFHPSADNVFVINSEELATLYHFPGEVAATPGIPRIDSVKSDAPTNLPI